MASSNENASYAAGQDGRFHTTRWSLVMSAVEGVGDEAREALAALCQAYWYPLYAFARRRGISAADAEDLTQAFFAEVLEKDFLHGVHRDRGRFRSFLMAAFRHFLSNQVDRQRAWKRGGRHTRVSFDAAEAESRFQQGRSRAPSPEAEFEKQWALTLLEKVRAALADEAQREGKSEQYARLSVLLAGSRQRESYASAGRALGMTEAAVKVAVHRLRSRFRKRLRDEIAQTVAGPEDVDDEVRTLFEALRQS
jgi:RNA polymerase sigma-70 factor (ECF subfamily)